MCIFMHFVDGSREFRFAAAVNHTKEKILLHSVLVAGIDNIVHARIANLVYVPFCLYLLTKKFFIRNQKHLNCQISFVKC